MCLHICFAALLKLLLLGVLSYFVPHNCKCVLHCKSQGCADLVADMSSPEVNAFAAVLKLLLIDFPCFIFPDCFHTKACVSGIVKHKAVQVLT